MQNNNQNREKASKSYWNKTERNKNVKFQMFAPTKGVRGFGKRMWNELFEKYLRNIEGGNKNLLELGCGGSAFLPYFARELGFHVYGIDYSERGCELAQQMCDANGVKAQIICADFFEAPTKLLGQFDVVVSFGVVEHFTDTAATLSRFARFLRAGGVMLTIVPNMSGLTGLAQRLFSRSVYDAHEIVSTGRLCKAHENAEMMIIENRYFMFMNFGVINPGNNPSLFKRLSLVTLKAMTGMVWAIESVLGLCLPTGFRHLMLFVLLVHR